MIFSKVFLAVSVVKVGSFLAGITVPRVTILDITPPTVSMPRVKGVTSTRRTLWVAPLASPDTRVFAASISYFTAGLFQYSLKWQLPFWDHIGITPPK